MSRAEGIVRWSGVSLILFSALARLMSSPSRIPYWDIDPLTSWTPDTTRTPAMSLLFDSLVWLAASAIIWAEGRAGRSIAWKTGVLALVGCIGVALHGWMLTPLTAFGGTPPTHGDFQSMILGSSWASAIVGAWAMSMAARDVEVKRIAAMVLLGVVIVLGAKGAIQVFIEHPRLVADFNAKKDEMLTAQGFQPGSVNARLFERRLVQSEATGWFGLSNVYGSIMAAGCAAFFALAISATRAARNTSITTGEAGLLWLATAIAATGLALSGSKGAISAGALGCMCVVAALRIGSTKVAASESAKRRMMLRWTPIILPIFALLAICLRGIVGERVGELSLYFRWQYLLAAVRIILAHPLFGTGPAGFKDQYLLHKEPTNPEEIDSPHCLPMDWLATLGLFGAAWVILWVVWLSRADATASAASLRAQSAVAGTQELPPRPTALAVAPVVVIFTSLAFSWWAEWAAMLPEMLAVYALAGLAWWLVARTGSRLAEADPRALNIALFGAAVVLGTHCMIEVTGVFASSVGWVMAVGAFAAASSPAYERPQRLPRASLALASMIGIVIAGLLASCCMRVTKWEFVLWLAAADARSLADPTALEDDALRTATLERITSRLDQALVLEPTILEPALRASAIELWRSMGEGEPTNELAHSVINRASKIAARQPASSKALSTYAKAWSATERYPQFLTLLKKAASTWERIVPLDPHGLTPPVELARISFALGRMHDAARWARRALEVHDNLHLDPLKGLTDAEKADMESLAKE